MDFQTKIPRHVAGYLATKLTVPCRAGMNQDEKDRPFFCVLCEDYEMEHPRTWVSGLIVRLLSTSERAIADDAQLVNQARSALLNRSDFDAYIMGLSESERVGWQLHKFAVESGNAEVEDGDETRQIDMVLRVSTMV